MDFMPWWIFYAIHEARPQNLPFLFAFALAHPVIQQLDDGLLHALGRVSRGKVLADTADGKGDIPRFRFLLLRHDAEHGVVCELAFLREPFHALRL